MVRGIADHAGDRPAGLSGRGLREQQPRESRRNSGAPDHSPNVWRPTVAATPFKEALAAPVNDQAAVPGLVAHQQPAMPRVDERGRTLEQHIPGAAAPLLSRLVRAKAACSSASAVTSCLSSSEAIQWELMWSGMFIGTLVICNPESESALRRGVSCALSGFSMERPAAA